MGVFNNELDVKNAIESIINQSYNNFEFLICDDSSEDNSYIICKEMSKIDNRIKLYKNNKNIGLTKTLNFLISKAEGSIIARQDADDLSHHSRLEKQIPYLDKYDAVVCRSNSIQDNTIKPKVSHLIPYKLIINFKNPFVHGSLVINKLSLNKIQNYKEDFYYAQDFKLFSELIYKKNKIKYLKSPLYFHNTKNNISSKHLDEQNYFASKIKTENRKKFFKF